MNIIFFVADNLGWDCWNAAALLRSLIIMIQEQSDPITQVTKLINII